MVQDIIDTGVSVVNNLKKFLWLISITALVTTGCANHRKAHLKAGNDPQAAIAEVSQRMSQAEASQYDVLADEQYLKGSEFLAEAKQALKQGEESEKVIEKAAISKAYFQDAKKIANARKSSSPRILRARKSALSAGVKESDLLIESLTEIDSDLKSETEQFSKSLSPEDFSDFQKKYLVLESKAVQFTQLNSADQAIKQALEDDADDLAPKSLRTASLDYKTAMNIIEQSPRSPKVYKKSVDEALASTTLLYDVMNVILGAKGTPEHIALQIVKQKRALGELSSNVGKLQANLKSTKESLQEKEGALKRTEGVLKNQEAQLAKASTQVKFQQAMDEAQKVIPQSDALVYQQGNKLVFRLKRINFRSGTAVIPKASEKLISKVDAIIKKLDAEKVVVQGHTDSVGSAKVNKKLSKARASAVAKYLSSLRGGYKLTYSGYGESHPIASNETPEGRATNRRVDLVLSVKQ